MSDSRHIALFGGSFNPLHNGHLSLARHVLRHCPVDEVWLMVSPHNPLKEQAELLPESVRYGLAAKALEDESGIRASNFEFSLPRPSYTWRTLRALVQKYPGCRFSLLIGADNWHVFPRWAHSEEILSSHSLFVYPRPGYPMCANALPPNVHLVNAPQFPFSSTDVRNGVRRGADISAMVPRCIVDDVKRLYTP